ncbi:MAG TPA: cadherin-like beta sandwich domain-containing protein, partial [Spirochaetota bacterium]|nr:cadherin-like beta sandwich domain-containing protein [Spirochaetota bacterium]
MTGRRILPILAVWAASIIMLSSCGGGGGGSNGGKINGYDVNLSGLETSDGTLSPSFEQTTTSYSVTVPATVTSIKIKPTSVDSSAVITVNGVVNSSGSYTSDIELVSGSTTNIPIVVTAPDKTTSKSYYIGVYRQLTSSGKSSNANLSSLLISNGTLTPKFDPNITSYCAEIASTETTIKITPAVAYDASKIDVNNIAVSSGSASSAIPLSYGINKATVKVAAEDGTMKTYSIDLVRVQDKSKNAYLSSLYLSSGTLSPLFSKTKTIYSAEVSSNVSSITVTPAVSGVNATVKVNGSLVATNAASLPVNLSAGSNKITVEVWAEDTSSYLKYVITVTRLAPGVTSSNANQAGLSTDIGTISPEFDPAVTSYTVYTNGSGITFTPTAAGADAAVSVNGVTIASGTTSAVIPASTSPVSIVITADDGTTKTYMVTIVNDAVAPNPGTVSIAKSEQQYVNLSWSAASDNLSSVSDLIYTIYRSKNNNIAT